MRVVARFGSWVVHATTAVSAVERVFIEKRKAFPKTQEVLSHGPFMWRRRADSITDILLPWRAQNDD